jgi:hypothetical protein
MLFSIICLTLSAAIWYAIFKYRIHFHVTYTSPKKRDFKPSNTDSGLLRSIRPQESAPVPPIRGKLTVSHEPLRRGSDTSRPDSRRGNPSTPDSETRKDVESALRNLGCRPAIAKAAAARATQESTDFDKALKLAIGYATSEAA